MKIIQHRKIFYVFSLAVLVPGLVFLCLYGLRLGIDFTGGTIIEYSQPGGFNKDAVIQALQKASFAPQSVKLVGADHIQFKLQHLATADHEKLSETMTSAFAKAQEINYSAIGPTIGKELRTNAIYATIVVFLTILIYISWSFRKVSNSYVHSWVYGSSALIALVHDLLIVVGIFAILGKFFDIEVDTMFVTALLTVLGFSVHDTIVVFDRIRERIRLSTGKETFEELVNTSVQQTLVRSLATSFTVIIVLSSLLLFGGESIRSFILALLIGMISGTYSSIFVASPLLVSWYLRKSKA